MNFFYRNDESKLKKFGEFHFSEKAVYYFTTFFLITMLAHILLLILGKGNQLDLYFLNMNDFFADFLNSVRYSSGRDPWFDETIHPMHHTQNGLWYMFCWIAKRIAGIKQGESLNDLWNNHTIILISFYYLTVQFLLIGHSMICLCKKFKSSRLLLLPLMMSYPMLYSIERANHVMFTAACIAYFISFYDSENKKFRYFACFCFALAASQKIYPVVFGFLYFEKKQWKEILISGIMSFLLFFVPFFFFKHGIQNLPRLLYNAKEFSKNENRNTLISVVRILCVISLFFSVFQKRLFDRLVLIVFPLLLLSTRAGFYTTLYFYPLVILLFNQNEDSYYSITLFNRYFFFVYFSCLLMPLQIMQFFFPHFRNENLIVYHWSLKFIFIVLFLFETISALKESFFSKMKVESPKE